MTVRHTILAVGALLVLGATIYLVREVSKSPSTAQAKTEPPAREVTPPPKADDPPKINIGTGPQRVAKRDTPERPPEVAAGSDAQPALPEEVQPPTTANLDSLTARANPKLDAIMAEANRHYDNGDFDDAKQIAQKVLEKSPNNTRMLRIIVSAECIAGDSSEAQKYFMQLPVADRAQMKLRCDRYGVTLKEP